jgi:GTPase SAR1 family protein
MSELPEQHEQMQQRQQHQHHVLPILERLDQGLKTPICLIVVGMAGSGKTTLVTALQRSLKQKQQQQQQQQEEIVGEDSSLKYTADPVSSSSSEAQEENESSKKKKAGYFINLDPAALLVPFAASIDIRDTVDYKVSLDYWNPN